MDAMVRKALKAEMLLLYRVIILLNFFRKKFLNNMPLFIKFFIINSRYLRIAPRWNYSLHSTFCRKFNYTFTVVPIVCYQIFRFKIFDQLFLLLAFRVHFRRIREFSAALRENPPRHVPSCSSPFCYRHALIFTSRATRVH